MAQNACDQSPVGVNDADWLPLLIEGTRINFLQPSLRLQCDFLQRTDVDNRLQWKLTFFKRNPCEVSIYLNFFDVTSVSVPSPIGKSIWMPLNKQHSEVDYHGFICSASQWLRDSQTLDESEFKNDAGRHVAIDSKGIAFLSPNNQKITFLRCLILQALAYAYQKALSGLSQQLTTSLDDVVSTRKIYKKLITFNAQCFFSYPVESDGVALPLIWERLREKFNIERVNQELTRQTHDIAQLLAELAREASVQQDRKRDEAELERSKLAEIAQQVALRQELNRTATENSRIKIIRFWGGVVSACLAVVSILQGLQAPPAQLYDNLTLWRTLLF